MALIDTGYLEFDELKSIQKLPDDERYAKGPVAVIECVQEIPCNPCEAACSCENCKALASVYPPLCNAHPMYPFP